MIKKVLLFFKMFVVTALVASCSSNNSFYFDKNIEFDNTSEIKETTKTDSKSDYVSDPVYVITDEENLFEYAESEMDNGASVSEKGNYTGKSFYGYLGDELFVSDGVLIEDGVLLFENLAYGSMPDNKSKWFIIREGDSFGKLRISDAASTYSMNANGWKLESEIIRIEGAATLTGFLSYVPDGSLPAYETSGHEVFFLADMQSFIDSGMPILYGGTSYLPTLNKNENFSNETPIFSLGSQSDYKDLDAYGFLTGGEPVYAEITIENITMVSGLNCGATANIVSVEFLG